MNKFTMKIVFVLFIFFFFNLSGAKAGLILSAPTYTGLNQGLVGYWSFDAKDII